MTCLSQLMLAKVEKRTRQVDANHHARLQRSIQNFSSSKAYSSQLGGSGGQLFKSTLSSTSSLKPSPFVFVFFFQIKMADWFFCCTWPCCFFFVLFWQISEFQTAGIMLNDKSRPGFNMNIQQALNLYILCQSVSEKGLMIHNIMHCITMRSELSNILYENCERRFNYWDHYI